MQAKILYIAIMVLSILGYFLGTDFTQTWGCVSFSFTDLTPYRISFLATTLILLTWALISGRPKLRFGLTVLELTIWLIILITMKGGYATGIGGTPDDSVFLYDLASLFLRLYLLAVILDLHRLMKTKIAVVTAVLAIALLVIFIKAEFFSFPMIEFF